MCVGTQDLHLPCKLIAIKYPIIIETRGDGIGGHDLLDESGLFSAFALNNHVPLVDLNLGKLQDIEGVQLDFD